MTNIQISLFSKNLRRVAAYVCLSAGILSLAQMPLAVTFQVYAEENPISEVVTPDPVVVVDPVVIADPVVADEPIAEVLLPIVVAPVIDALNPTEGFIGSTVVITGSNFSATNTIQFGLTTIADVPSTDGTSLSFIVPSVPVTDISYDVLVINESDLSSNSILFLVNGVRARVILSDLQNQNGGNVASVVFVGADNNPVPVGEWFSVHENGAYFTDPNIVGYEDVAGLAVERQNNKVRLVLHGSFDNYVWREHVTGYIEFDGATVYCQSGDTAGNNQLEDGFNKSTTVSDEVWVTGQNTTKSYFWLTVSSADDGFYTEFDINRAGQLCPGANIISPDEEPPTEDETLLTLISLTPNQGPIGTTTILTGTGFTPVGNNITFGTTTISNVSSTDSGTKLSITVPWVPEMDISYQVFVVNATASTSNTLLFKVIAPEINDDDDNNDDPQPKGGGGGGGGGSSGGCTPGYPCADNFKKIEVVSVVPPVVSPTACPAYLNEYIKFGANNNPVEVTKLQNFLNSHEGANLVVTGIYDQATFDAVKTFQAKYANDILQPWGDDLGPTGYVFITTLLKINMLSCGNNGPIDLNLRDYYPNPGTPGQEIGLIDEVDDTLVAENESTSTVASATSTNLLQLAAAGVLDFLGIYPWWWWLLVIVLIIVISWLLKKTDDEDDQDGNSTDSVNTGYVPSITS